ncbi:MAG: rubrerythrin family protein [Anaerolineae bacterium]|nr:rubrerythrin family protein [Anaerolineae bacterium]
MKTIDDLKAAFAGESQANRKYLAWSKQADREGYPDVAKLFRAVAEAETVHAHNHFRTLGEVKTTAENLEAAMGGEHYEVVSMYPEFMKDAEAEEQDRALKTFTWAWEVEQVHEVLYKEALQNLKQGDGKDLQYWVCKTCGYTVTGDAPPDECPICKSKATAFKEIV